jgi:hypothetical protein
MREADVGSQSVDTIKLKFRKHFGSAGRAGSVCTEVAEVSNDRRTKGSLGTFTLSLGSIRTWGFDVYVRRTKAGASMQILLWMCEKAVHP